LAQAISWQRAVQKVGSRICAECTPVCRAGMANREAILSGWGGRGNAKSAGTHDMPIPGMVTSRRQPRPQKKKEPEPAPVVYTKADLKADLKAAARQRKAAIARKRSRSRSHRKRARSRSSSSSADPRDSAADREKDRQEEENEKKREELEEQAVRARWKALQAERDARQAEEARIAEERRLQAEQRNNERKKKLKGAFATGDSDDEDEDRGTRELAARLEKKASSRAELPRPSALNGFEPAPNTLQLQPSGAPLGAASAGSASSALALPGSSAAPMMGATGDAIAIRASLADPAASRNFTPGEVAEKYKLLQEMKRKFRRADFGGPVPDPKERVRWRSRSRKEKRGRSNSRSRYDSVWIKPSSK